MAQNKHRYQSDDDPNWSHLSRNSKGTPTYRELIEERTAQRTKSKKDERFVRLGHDLTDSPAWKVLGSHARDAYAWIEHRYSGNNNGKIPMSVRELGRLMGVNAKTASKALKRLQAFGFLAVHQKGHMGLQGDEQRRATRWRLTEHRCGDSRATRDYIDVDINKAEHKCNEGGCNIKFLRTPTGDVTCRVEVRTRTTTGHVAKMTNLEAEETRVGSCPPAPRRQGSTYPHAAQSIAGEAREVWSTAEDHQHAREPPATGRSTTSKRRKADVSGNGFHKS